MGGNPQSNLFNAIAVRASYNTDFKRFPLESQKTRGLSTTPSPPRPPKAKTWISLSFLVLGWILSTGKVSLISVRWHVARLPGTLVDTLPKSVSFYA